MRTVSTATVVLLALASLAAPMGVVRAAESPADAARWNERGLELSGEGRLAEAVEAFRRARRAAPDDATIRRNVALARSNLAVQLIEQGEIDLATGHAREAERLEPDDPIVVLNLAACLDEQGFPGRAAELVVRARKLGPGVAAVHERMGAVHHRGGRLAEAAAEWEKALAIEPDDPGLKERLARVRASLAVQATLSSQLSSHFEVLHDPERGVLASLVLRELEAAYDIVGADIQHRVDEPLRIVLLSTEQFRDATGAHAWVAGLYDGQIRLPVKGAGSRQRELLARARHEYVHAALAPLGRRAPPWLHEGLAQIHEGRSVAPARKRVALAPPLAFSALARSFAGTEQESTARRQYDTSLAFVAWLRGGERASAFHLAMRRLFADATLDAAFEEGFDAPLAELYDRFQAALR